MHDGVGVISVPTQSCQGIVSCQHIDKRADSTWRQVSSRHYDDT